MSFVLFFDKKHSLSCLVSVNYLMLLFCCFILNPLLFVLRMSISNIQSDDIKFWHVIYFFNRIISIVFFFFIRTNSLIFVKSCSLWNCFFLWELRHSRKPFLKFFIVFKNYFKESGKEIFNFVNKALCHVLSMFLTFVLSKLYVLIKNMCQHFEDFYI